MSAKRLPGRRDTKPRPSGRDAVASLCTATLDEGTAMTGAHADAESMLALPSAVVRLIRTLHDAVSPCLMSVRCRVEVPRKVTERRQCRWCTTQTTIRSHPAGAGVLPRQEHAKTRQWSRNTDEGHSRRTPPNRRYFSVPYSPGKRLPPKGFPPSGSHGTTWISDEFAALELVLEPSLCSPSLS